MKKVPVKIISVKVTPRAHKNEVIGWEGEILKIRVRAVPENGNANAAVLALLAAYFDISKSALRLIAGSSSRLKRIEIFEKISGAHFS